MGGLSDSTPHVLHWILGLRSFLGLLHFHSQSEVMIQMTPSREAGRWEEKGLKVIILVLLLLAHDLLTLYLWWRTRWVRKHDSSQSHTYLEQVS